MYSNDEASLELYKKSLKGTCVDYVIRFHNKQRIFEKVIPIAFDLVKQLVENFHQNDIRISGRLVAVVCYYREEKDEKVEVYHPSYRSEVIDDVENFFITHMLKIIERMGEYNREGSKLTIDRICEIHLQISCLNKLKQS